MADLLDGARLKLARAEEHLHTLDDEIATYLELEPYRPILNIQPSDKRVLMVEFRVEPRPPERLGLIIGDCVHNLRSCLDHIACALVRKRGGNCETPPTQFPIYTSKTNKKGNPRVVGVGPAVEPKFLAFVETLQPYHRGQDAPSHPLAILAHLSNVDKHRTIHVVAGGLAGTSCYVHFPNSTFGGQFRADVVYEDTPFAAFQFPEPFDPAACSEMEVEVQGFVFVALAERGPWGDQPAALILEDIFQFIRNIVLPGAEPFFD